MIMKTKITLRGEMETLLIPLYGRAESTREGLCSDPYAVETLEKIEYDFHALKVPKKTRVLMALRSRILDEVTRDFLVRNPGAVVLSLGSGLDARYARVRGYGRWYDLDFPEVAALREKLLPAIDEQTNLPSSVTDWAWLDQVPSSGAAALVIAEGLTMYLTDEEVCELFNRIIDKFPDACIAFDAYSGMTVQRAGRIPSLKKTGAAIRWGIDDPKELERACPALQYEKTLPLTDPRYTKALDPFYRLAFRVAAAFPAAREAHRVLVYHAKRR
jgi:O-methyltransferase involved in polyketide biosynthesis